MRYLRAFLGSMTARLFFLLLLGMAAAALIASSISNFNSRRDLERQADERTADRLQSFAVFIDAAPPELRQRMLDENWSGILSHDLATAGSEPDTVFSRILASRGGLLAAATAEKAAPDLCLPPMNRPSRRGRRFFQPPWEPPDMPPDISRDNPRDRRDMPPFAGAGDPSFSPTACRLVSLTLGDGTPLRLGVETRWIQPVPSRLLDPAFVGLLGVGIVLLAYAAALLASAPLRRLAIASKQLGQDLHRQPLALTGPTEVRQAVAAFNAMQERLQSHFAERTQMLAAITHDLQTPLTRLRLRLERVTDQELRERLVADLQAMRALIDEGLELARTAETPESVVMLDLDSVLESLVEDAVEAGLNAEFSGGCGAVLSLRPLATRRIFANLIDNALVHGGSAIVHAVRDQGTIRVFVRDRGPGIPPEFLERVFDPFFRTEESRSRETGGTGLGLTIARMLAAKVGASLTLRNHPDGGLEAEVTWLEPELQPTR